MVGQWMTTFWIISHVMALVVLWDNYIPPTMTLVSCLPETITMKITGATSGGLLYTRTTQAYNIQPTVDGDIDYSCTFEECDIQWSHTFYIVVQRRSAIQTQHDVILSFMCSPDLNQITPALFSSSDFGSDNVTVVKFRPVAKMSFYISNEQISSGSYVKLGTEVMMTIEVTNNEYDMFDFNVKACRASSIELISEKCSLDEELFPNFNKSRMATVHNYFHMFRPTTTYFGSVNIIFSCDLSFCMGWCPEVECNDTSESVEKREAEIPVIVGTMLRVGLEDQKEIVPEVYSGLCMPLGLFIGFCTVFGVLLIMTLTGICVCYRKQKTTKKENEKKTEEKNKSVEIIENHINEQKNPDSKPTVNVNESCDSGIMGKKNLKFTNQTPSADIKNDKRGPINIHTSNSINRQNMKVENGLQTADDASTSATGQNLTTAYFKQFSSAIQMKLDKSCPQTSKPQPILSVLKNPTELKPILKSSKGSTQTQLSAPVQPSMGDNKMAHQGSNSSIVEKGDNSTMTEQESETRFSNFLSVITRRRSSIMKTGSKENLLEYCNEKKNEQ